MTKLFNIGARVATRKVEGDPMVIGSIAAGTTGTITHIEENTNICKTLGARFLVHIKLDEHNDNLDEWGNELHLLIDATCNDADECIGERLRALPTKQEILDAAYEGLNGLSMGWMMANVKDDAKRAELQAPINAGIEALKKLINRLEASGQCLVTNCSHACDCA